MHKLILFIILAVIYLLLPKNDTCFIALKIKKYFIPFFLVITMICLIIFSDTSYLVARDAFLLWINNIVPSLLPFLICVDLLKSTPFLTLIGRLLTPIMRPLFNIPGVGAFAVAMGMTSGYPIGSRITSELYSSSKINKAEAIRLLSFTNTSGPLFIISAVGVSMLHNKNLGILLLVTHFLGSLSVGLVFRNYKSKASSNSDVIISQIPSKGNIKETLNVNNFGYFMGIAIQNGISTLILVCGYIMFFSILGNLLERLGILTVISGFISPLLKILNIDSKYSIGIVKGFLEITSGIKDISNLIIDDIVGITIISFLLGFGGFSIVMQTSSIISKTDLPLIPYIIGKILHGVFSGLYTYLILKYTSFIDLFAVQTFAPSAFLPTISHEVSNLYTCVGTLFLLAIVLKFKKKIAK